MSSNQEFTESWQRLGLPELNAIAIIARSAEASIVSHRMAVFLANSLNAEAEHREHFKTKRDQIPEWDKWTDGEISNAYKFAQMTERAAAGGSEKLLEWAELLRKAICSEMSARLQVRHWLTGELGK
jgi:hypothetical protein